MEAITYSVRKKDYPPGMFFDMPDGASVPIALEKRGQSIIKLGHLLKGNEDSSHCYSWEMDGQNHLLMMTVEKSIMSRVALRLLWIQENEQQAFLSFSRPYKTQLHWNQGCFVFQQQRRWKICSAGEDILLDEGLILKTRYTNFWGTRLSVEASVTLPTGLAILVAARCLLMS